MDKFYSKTKLNLVKFNPEIGSYRNITAGSRNILGFFFFLFNRETCEKPVLRSYSRAANQPPGAYDNSNVPCTITSWFQVKHWVPTELRRNIQLYTPPVFVVWSCSTFYIGSPRELLFHFFWNDTTPAEKTLMAIPDCNWVHCPWLRRNDLDVRNGLLSGLETISWLHAEKYVPHTFSSIISLAILSAVSQIIIADDQRKW